MERGREKNDKQRNPRKYRREGSAGGKEGRDIGSK